VTIAALGILGRLSQLYITEQLIYTPYLLLFAFILISFIFFGSISSIAITRELIVRKKVDTTETLIKLTEQVNSNNINQISKKYLQKYVYSSEKIAFWLVIIVVMGILLVATNTQLLSSLFVTILYLVTFISLIHIVSAFFSYLYLLFVWQPEKKSASGKHNEKDTD